MKKPMDEEVAKYWRSACAAKSRRCRIGYRKCRVEVVVVVEFAGEMHIEVAENCR